VNAKDDEYLEFDMEYEQLENAIQESGFATKREQAFSGMREVTGAVGRLVCGRRDKTTGHFLASLWVQSNDAGHWYLGLFSGPIYKVHKTDEFAELLIALLRRELLEDRAISPNACSRYSLEEL
jgi:hypothetical protein